MRPVRSTLTVNCRSTTFSTFDPFSSLPILLYCIVNQQRVTFEMNTGSAFTLISEEHSPIVHCLGKLQENYHHLASFTGQSVNIKDQVIVDACYEKKLLRLPLLIYMGPERSLMGRNWIFSGFNVVPKLDDYSDKSSIQQIKYRT